MFQLSIKQYIIIAVIVLVVLIFGYFTVGRPLAQKMGLVQDKEEKTASKLLEEAKTMGYWTSAYYVDYQQNLEMTTAQADDLAKRIAKAWGVFNDDETAVVGAIKEVKSRAQLSYLVARYKATQNKDLLYDIEDYLSEKELYNILVYTSKLK